jgi:hypothetical protein
VRWGRGAKPNAVDGKTQAPARLSSGSAIPIRSGRAHPTALARRKADLLAMRNWSNTRRGANYPLLGAKRPRADEQPPAHTPQADVSLPLQFHTARLYWFTKSPVFARRDPPRGSDERIPDGEIARVQPSASAATAVFRKDGDFWRVGYKGTWIAVRSSKGLVYVQYLLLHPEEKVHVSHLAALGEQRWSEFAGAGSGERDLSHQRLHGDRDSGDVLDERARREYRARLMDLRAELEEALHWADLERADSIRREIDFVATQLARAFGRTGRARKMSDPIERVRKAVTNRIHHAIERITRQDPSLGRHLNNAIRTGFFCWYSPEPPVTWTSDRSPLPGGTG